MTTKHLIESGAIGRVFMVETSYWHRSPRAEPGHWFTRKEVAGSVFLLGGCHAVDAARWLAGADVVEVTAYSTCGPARVRLRPDRDSDRALCQWRHRPHLGHHGMRDAVRVQRDRHGGWPAPFAIIGYTRTFWQARPISRPSPPCCPTAGMCSTMPSRRSLPT